MQALRHAKNENGITINDMGEDPLNVVVLAYHFARAGAKAQGMEMTMPLDDFEAMVEANDMANIADALQKVMQVDGKKKGVK